MIMQDLYVLRSSLREWVAERDATCPLKHQMALLLELQSQAIKDRNIKVSSDLSKTICAVERSVAAKEVRENELLYIGDIRLAVVEAVCCLMENLVGTNGKHPTLDGSRSPEDQGEERFSDLFIDGGRLDQAMEAFLKTLKGLRNSENRETRYQ